MSQQDQLFYEDIYEALRAAVQAAGGAKVVGPKLWPTKPVPEAQRALLDALNRDRERKLDPEEQMTVLRLAREAGFHGGIRFVCEHLGYSVPHPVDPKDELAELQRRFIEQVDVLHAMGDKIERLTKAPLQAVR
jgi:hypothetical protein